MKAVKKRVFQLNRSTKIVIFTFIFVVVLVGVAVFMQFRESVKDLVDAQARKSLRSVGLQNAKVLDEQMNAKLLVLESVAKEISRTGNTDVDKILDILGNHRDSYGCYDMGVVDREGLCRTVNGNTFTVDKDDPYFGKGMAGEPSISDSYLMERGAVPVNLIIMPVIIDGETELLLTVAYRSVDATKMADISSFDGNGRSAVINGQGCSTSYMDGMLLEDESCEMAAYLSKNRPVVPDELQDTEGPLFVSFEKDGDAYLGIATLLESSSWYLLTYVSEDYMYSAAREINQNVLYILLGLYMLIAVISGLFVVVYSSFQNRIFRIVFRDRLTGEKNYQYYKHIFPDLTAAEKVNRYLVNFDIDKFKMINLIYGVKVGDDILKKIFLIFQETLPGDKIYHYHADIFVVIMSGKSKEEISRKLDLFSSVVEQKIENKELLELTVSYGICPLSQFDQINLVYSNALLAKNEIKGSFTEKYRFYDDNLAVQVKYRNIELAFKEAIQNKEFKVWYQPKYDMRSRMICGAEALVRWKREDGEIMSPGSFIPIFENTGQIVELDEYVLRTVCTDICRAKKDGIDMMPISVNLSKLHLIKPGIVEKIQAITRIYGITGRQISFEITESTSISDKKVMGQMVGALHRMGFQVDMDDYGTGSSTLRSLSDTSFDTIKLDKSFIDSIGSEKMDIIIDSTINMANHLNMQIIAEGVENEEQADFLVEHRCYMAQGYHYSKPVEKDVYLRLLRESALQEGGQALPLGSPPESLRASNRNQG